MRSHDKLKTLYVHLQKTYEHKNRVACDLLWEAPTLNTTWLQVVHVKLDKIISPFSQDLWALKYGRVLTSWRSFRTQHLSCHWLLVLIYFKLNLILFLKVLLSKPASNLVTRTDRNLMKRLRSLLQEGSFVILSDGLFIVFSWVWFNLFISTKFRYWQQLTFVLVFSSASLGCILLQENNLMLYVYCLQN